MSQHHHDMTSEETLPGVGQATKCLALSTISHRPMPLRFVWHHILPQVCGGKTEPGNLVELCDSCHYTVHILLYSLAQGKKLKVGTIAQKKFANQGYEAALSAGTEHLIPKESDVTVE